MTTIEAKIESIKLVQQAVESTTAAVVEYLQTAAEPNADEAHKIIEATLAAHECESPEGHIVSGGIKSSEPHEVGSGPLLPGEPIVIDIYPRSKKTGYYADMSRTVCIGKPSSALQSMYNTVLEAQQTAIACVAPGVLCREVHQAAVWVFESAGYTTSGKGTEFEFREGFVHSVGHGVGKEIHERPHISARSEEVLEVGDVITIEPGLYYTNIGGVRLEDLLVVTEKGCQNLTTFPKQLAI